MSAHARLAITTTVAAAVLLAPGVDSGPRFTGTPVAASTRPHGSARHQPTAPAVPCALSRRLDLAGRHWSTARGCGYDPCAAQPLLHRLPQREHDRLR